MRGGAARPSFAVAAAAQSVASVRAQHVDREVARRAVGRRGLHVGRLREEEVHEDLRRELGLGGGAAGDAAAPGLEHAVQRRRVVARLEAQLRVAVRGLESRRLCSKQPPVRDVPTEL